MSAVVITAEEANLVLKVLEAVQLETHYDESFCPVCRHEPDLLVSGTDVAVAVAHDDDCDLKKAIEIMARHWR